MDVMLSQRGNQLYTFNNYNFYFAKCLKDGVQRWRCSKKRCPAFLKFTSGLTLIETNEVHNHPPIDEGTLNRSGISNRLKRKATDDISAQPSKLVHRELRGGDIPTLTVKDINYIKRNVRNERLRHFPEIPRSKKEALHYVSKNNIKTNQSENFLLFTDDLNDIIGFSTASNLSALSDCKKIYVDGTFKCCPAYFYQLFIIHGLINCRLVPLVFCLLPSKELNVYKRMFQNIRVKCEELNLIFEPKDVFMDFEIAIHKAVQDIWPAASIRGCRFHLGQNWWRKIQELGLSAEYKKNGEISHFLKLFFGLPFVRPEEVEEFFIEEIMSIQPQSQKVRDFTDYILETYIEEGSLFPPTIWARFESTVNRTTNGCEGFHNKLNRLLPQHHPNIFILIEILLLYCLFSKLILS